MDNPTPEQWETMNFTERCNWLDEEKRLDELADKLYKRIVVRFMRNFGRDENG